MTGTARFTIRMASVPGALQFSLAFTRAQDAPPEPTPVPQDGSAAQQTEEEKEADARSNEIRGIPPGGTQFESLGASRRDGVDFEVNWFPWSSTRVFASLSWVDVTLRTPVTPAANHLPDIPDYVHQAGVETQVDAPGRLPGRLTLAADLSLYGNRDLNTLATLQSEKYERATAKVVYHAERAYRVWVGSVYYPGSRFGEPAFLFGTRVGVRANPRLTFEGGLAYTFE